jgi:hypothetical protein
MLVTLYVSALLLFVSSCGVIVSALVKRYNRKKTI